MDARKAIDILARAKVAFGKKRDVDCLGGLIMVLKGMGGASLPLDVAGAVRDLLLLVGKDKVVTEVLGTQLLYQQGQEKHLLVCLAKVYKVAKEAQDREDMAEVRARKLKLDHTLSDGMKYIKQGEFSDADRCFTEALTFYKDEHAVFLVIGEAFMAADAPKRAFPYLSKGVIAAPEHVKLKEAYDKCMLLKDQKK